MARHRGLYGRIVGRFGPETALYTLYEGPASCAAMLGKWEDDAFRWPTEYPRQPPGLQLLDLLKPDAIRDARTGGDTEVRGVVTTQWADTLDMAAFDWPEPDRSHLGTLGESRLYRFATAKQPLDPRPTGVIPAEVWLDQEGRLRRLSHRFFIDGRDRGRGWATTELWDFAGPPPIADREAQPVIDPVR